MREIARWERVIAGKVAYLLVIVRWDRVIAGKVAWLRAIARWDRVIAGYAHKGEKNVEEDRLAWYNGCEDGDPEMDRDAENRMDYGPLEDNRRKFISEGNSANKNDGSVIALIDGDCGMCSKLSQWIIARDTTGAFRFASLQSPVGKRLLREGGLPEEGLSTFVLIDDGRYYTKSSAALRAARKLGGKWRLAYGFRVVPRRLRDAAYDYVANRRYRWFGQADSCPMPTAQLRARFIDMESGEREAREVGEKT